MYVYVHSINLFVNKPYYCLVIILLLLDTLFIFGCAGSLLLRASFSLVVASRDYSLTAVCGLLMVVTSRCGGRALEHRLISCGAQALVTPWHVGSFQTRNWTRVPCIGMQILYCQDTREVMLDNLFQESSGTWLVMLAHQSMLWGLDSSFSSWIWGDFLDGMGHWGLPKVALVVKNPPASAGDAGSVLVSGRSPGGGNGSPLQYSCLENPMDREAWWATVHGVTKSRTLLKRLSTHVNIGC